MQLFANTAYLSSGWAHRVLIDIDESGEIRSCRPDQEPTADSQRIEGIVIPGMLNVHSHAFQRALAGLAETGQDGQESFWTWRKVMYQFLQRLNPDDCHVIARQLYVEMLKAGYTSVGEFHYLHHGPKGVPYDSPTTMADAVVHAARQAGIGIELLPVFYQYRGFDRQPLEDAQKRFGHTMESYQSLVSACWTRYQGDANLSIGIAPHSLRAVALEDLDPLIAFVDQLNPQAPIHIHVAEQVQEVEQCVEACGARPVQRLLERQSVNHRWCLIHATHLSTAECQALARSGATAGLCPTTEANLGDGIFPIVEYLQHEGNVAIGSDSHVTVDPMQELRTIEYVQRAQRQSRVVLGDAHRSNGARLYDLVQQGGQRALGRKVGCLKSGYRADLLVLDHEHPNLVGRQEDAILDAMIFVSHSQASPICDVMVGGQWVIQSGRHREQDHYQRAYVQAMRRLLEAV